MKLIGWLKFISDLSRINTQELENREKIFNNFIENIEKIIYKKNKFNSTSTIDYLLEAIKITKENLLIKVKHCIKNIEESKEELIPLEDNKFKSERLKIIYELKY